VADLLGALEQVARSGRVGQPVFLRCQVTAPPQGSVAALAGALDAAVTLFEAAPDSLQVWGDESAGALHAVLLFRSGASVLITTGPGAATADAVLLGNRGAVYGPAAPGLLQERDDGVTAGSAAAEPFAALVRRALSTRQPIKLEAEGGA
jgi:hypothetical protein